MIKKTFLAICFAMLSLGAWAVKADPSLRTIKQPDGSLIQIRIIGDEHFHYVTDARGNLLVQRATGMFERATDTEVAEMKAKRSASTQRKAYGNEKLMGSSPLFPAKGKMKVPVLLVSFADRQSEYTTAEKLDSFMNVMEVDKTQYHNYRSVKKVFYDSSFGEFSPTFEYYGPFTVSGTSASYASGNNISALFKDVMAIADETVDFSQFDSNNDGYVDGIIMLYAGTGKHESGDKTDMWPCAATCQLTTNDGVKTYRICQTSEKRKLINSKGVLVYEGLDGNGTFIHEFGHMLGLPDLYTTNSAYQNDASKAKDNFGMEYWSIMDSGCYIGNSFRTMDFSAWEREILGWIDGIETLEQKPQNVTLKPLSMGGAAYRIINPQKTNEYWILENRQKVNGDLYMYGHGMIITHVDYDASAFSGNKVNYDVNHPHMYVIAADGELTSTYRATSAACYYGDPFPGTNLKGEPENFQPCTSFNNYQAYTGTIDLPITEIVEDTQEYTVSFKFMGGDTPSAIREASSNAVSAGIYTLDGVCVGTDRGSLPHGIYIQNGRKFVK